MLHAPLASGRLTHASLRYGYGITDIATKYWVASALDASAVNLSRAGGGVLRLLCMRGMPQRSIGRVRIVVGTVALVYLQEYELTVSVACMPL